MTWLFWIAAVAGVLVIAVIVGVLLLAVALWKIAEIEALREEIGG